MDLITITAIDKYSSDMLSRTFSTKSVDSFKESIQEFEKELSFVKYELTCDELIKEYSDDVINVLDELEVTY